MQDENQNSSHVLIRREKYFTTKRALTLQPTLAGPVETRLENLSGNWTWWGNQPRLSLDNGSLFALSHTKYIRLLAIVQNVQLIASMWERCIYRRGGGGWDPSCGGREALSFGRLLKCRKQEAKGRCSLLFNRRTHADSAHEVVGNGNFASILKNFPKTAQHEQSTKT